MLRVVLDTNVVVSGLLHQKGAPAAILDAATSKQFRCYISEFLLDEYREVLTRDYLGLDQRRTARFIGEIPRYNSEIVSRSPHRDRKSTRLNSSHTVIS